MADTNKQQVLVVDDVPRNLQLIGTVLKKINVKVVFAQNGKQAIEYAQIKKPDLILLDIMMPEMDGYEVCKHLKDGHTTKDIPIIFITALDDANDEYYGFKLGAVDYITKPFNQKIVQARVANYLRLKRKTDLLEKLSSIDGLTDIYNRRRFDEALDREWALAKREQTFLSLIIIDIDFFKQFNDMYGHAAGDDCLRKVAATLKTTLHRPTDFVARYGGEEFVVLLPNTDIQGAETIAEKLRIHIESLNIPHEKSKVASTVTISLGIAATIPGDPLSPKALIEIADKYLYESKENGRNQWQSFIIT
jgi:diguanylate cyclase (GGDEF)-like protein